MQFQNAQFIWFLNIEMIVVTDNNVVIIVWTCYHYSKLDISVMVKTYVVYEQHRYKLNLSSKTYCVYAVCDMGLV